MASVLIESVRQAELESQKRIEEAQLKAQEIIKTAKVKSDAVLKKAEAEASYELELQSERASKEAEEIIITAKNAAVLEAERIKKDSLTKQAAVNIKILNMIVN